MQKINIISEEENLEPIKGDKEIAKLAVDIYQDANELLVVAPLAGVKLDNLKISLNKEVLNIQGTREKPYKDEAEIEECFWGKFSRSIILPDSCDLEKHEAHFKDHILTIKFGKHKD
jgi:HSP20 family protein